MSSGVFSHTHVRSLTALMGRKASEELCQQFTIYSSRDFFFFLDRTRVHMEKSTVALIFSIGYKESRAVAGRTMNSIKCDQIPSFYVPSRWHERHERKTQTMLLSFSWIIYSFVIPSHIIMKMRSFSTEMIKELNLWMVELPRPLMPTLEDIRRWQACQRRDLIWKSYLWCMSDLLHIIHNGRCHSVNTGRTVMTTNDNWSH